MTDDTLQRESKQNGTSNVPPVAVAQAAAAAIAGNTPLASLANTQAESALMHDHGEPSVSSVARNSLTDERDMLPGLTTTSCPPTVLWMQIRTPANSMCPLPHMEEGRTRRLRASMTDSERMLK